VTEGKVLLSVRLLAAEGGNSVSAVAVVVAVVAETVAVFELLGCPSCKHTNTITNYLYLLALLNQQHISFYFIDAQLNRIFQSGHI
jgi:hypothetical protein